MKLKLTYHGLCTRRITVVQEAPILTASVRQNKPKVNNSNWQHDTNDEKTLGSAIEGTSFDFTFD